MKVISAGLIGIVVAIKKVMSLFEAKPMMEKATLQFNLKTVRTVGWTPLVFEEKKLDFEKVDQIQTVVNDDLITVVYCRRKQQSQMQWLPKEYPNGIQLVMQQTLGKLTQVDRYHLYPI